MGEPQHVADLVRRHREPAAAVFARAPVEIRIHDRGAPGDTGNGRRGNGWRRSPGIACGDRHSRGFRLFEADAGVAAVQLENLASPLLLLGRNRVVESVAGRIRAVVVLEVVLHDRNGVPGRRVERAVAVLRGIHRDLAVAGLIDRAGLNRVVEILRRREDRPARTADDGRDGGATRRERSQAGSAGEARVVVGEVNPFLPRGRGHDRCLRAADLQPVELVVGNGGKCQHGLAGGRVIGDGGGIEGGDGLVDARGRVDFEQLVGGDGRGRGLAEWILAVEIDGDRVAVLRQAAARASERLRHDRLHERTEVEAEVEIEGAAAAEGFGRGGSLRNGLEPAADHDPVGVVGQRVREAEDHLVLVGQVVDGGTAGHDREVDIRARSAEAVSGAAAPHDRDVAERRWIDGHARAEPEGECLRRFGQRGGILAADEKGRRAGGIRGDEVERHHATLFEPFELVVVDAVVTLASGGPPRPPIEYLVHCRLPG